MLVAAHEGSEQDSIGLDDAVSADVIRHARGGILHEGTLRPGRASVVRLSDEDVVLAQLELRGLPEAHVDGVHPARDVPLPVELRGGEGERHPVVPAVRRDRHRGGAEPQARAVDMTPRLDSRRHARHRRNDVEGIAERDVVIAAACATFGRGRHGRRILRAVRLTLIDEGRSTVIRPPEIHTAWDSADRADVDRPEAVDLDLGLGVLVDEDQAPLLLGELDLGLEAEIEALVDARAELIGRFGRRRAECGDRGVGVVHHTIDQHGDSIDARSRRKRDLLGIAHRLPVHGNLRAGRVVERVQVEIIQRIRPVRFHRDLVDRWIGVRDGDDEVIARRVGAIRRDRIRCGLGERTPAPRQRRVRRVHRSARRSRGVYDGRKGDQRDEGEHEGEEQRGNWQDTLRRPHRGPP